MEPLSIHRGLLGPAAEVSQAERVGTIVGKDIEVGKLVAHYVDCRILGVPIDMPTALAEASSPEVADEAASLMLVADMLLETV
jgi:hypothetical protein